MKTVVYSCHFVPAEWIAAHSIQPERIMPYIHARLSPAGLTQGICPYAASFLAEASSPGIGGPDGVIVTTVCDQMRRVSEMIPARPDRPVFLMNVPSTWQSVTAQKIYRTEIDRLGRFLEQLGGQAPTQDALTGVMLRYDTSRAALQAAGARLSPRRHAEAVTGFFRTGTVDVEEKGAASTTAPKGVPLALVGGPLMRHLLDLFDLVQEHGGEVVLDATGTGERTMPGRFNRREIRADPLSVLTDAYFGSMPDAFRRPNSGLYQWLKKELAKRGVKGVLFIRHTWCDTWLGEARRMKEWLDIPLLEIETGGSDSVDGRTVSRIQSFLEVLA